jgi:hypothetical protein
MPPLEVVLAIATTKVNCRRLSFRNGNVFSHSFDDGRQSFARYLSIGLSEFYSLNLPIRIATGSGCRFLKDHPKKPFTFRRGLLNGFGDVQFEFSDSTCNPAFLSPRLSFWRDSVCRLGQGRLLDRVGRRQGVPNCRRHLRGRG